MSVSRANPREDDPLTRIALALNISNAMLGSLVMMTMQCLVRNQKARAGNPALSASELRDRVAGSGKADGETKTGKLETVVGIASTSGGRRVETARLSAGRVAETESARTDHEVERESEETGRAVLTRNTGTGLVVTREVAEGTKSATERASILEATIVIEVIDRARATERDAIIPVSEGLLEVGPETNAHRVTANPNDGPLVAIDQLNGQVAVTLRLNQPMRRLPARETTTRSVEAVVETGAGPNLETVNLPAANAQSMRAVQADNYPSRISIVVRLTSLIKSAGRHLMRPSMRNSQLGPQSSRLNRQKLPRERVERSLHRGAAVVAALVAALVAVANQRRVRMLSR